MLGHAISERAVKYLSSTIKMRLWSLHPQYLDRLGLVALWREALLAQAVLHGKTRGYRNHPQLDRFKAHAAPLAAISLYLKDIHSEAMARGYSFDKSKIEPAQQPVALTVTTGQIKYEWKHLLAKLKVRSPLIYQQWQTIELPEVHPIFSVCPGKVESWERQ
ncbi:pyrimidine dimer DNA glycosylase/endonuclease V [Vreelandella nanhaiensis]|nr:pyrimidine dimer DNA glycosylase/endonuclease V [Halomonas nanhaiensis]